MNLVNVLIVFELDTWSRYLNMGFTLGDCLFGTVKLTKNGDHDIYGSSDYRIGFAIRSQFSLLIGEWGKSVVIFGVDNCSSRHNDKRKKDILVLGEG